MSPKCAVLKKKKSLQSGFDGYLAAVEKQEKAWIDEEWKKGGGRVIGGSRWTVDALKLMQQKFGLQADDLGIFSIRAYKEELEDLGPDHSSADSKTSYGHVCRRSDLDVRHFGRLFLNPRTHVQDLASLKLVWGYINKHALFMLDEVRRGFTSHLQNKKRRLYPEIQLVYSALHRLGVSWAPKPPYKALTLDEAIDRLRQISNRIEAIEANAIQNHLREQESSGAAKAAKKKPARKNGAKADIGGRPKKYPDDLIADVNECYNDFKANYREYKFTRCSWANFAGWAKEHTDLPEYDEGKFQKIHSAGKRRGRISRDKPKR